MLRPRGVDLHFEVELALVMGKGFKARGVFGSNEEEDMKVLVDAIECLYFFFSSTGVC